MLNLRDKSKSEWTTENNMLTSINAGSLQRIADSLEKMEKPYRHLLEEVERGRKDREYYKKDNQRLAHSNAALRGIIRKLKKGGKNAGKQPGA